MTELVNHQGTVYRESASGSTTWNKARTIAYWAFTSIVVFEMAAGGIWDLLRIEYVRVILSQLGYPMYLLTIMGIWKIPCSLVLMLPHFGRIKEWAYAGARSSLTAARQMSSTFRRGARLSSRWRSAGPGGVHTAVVGVAARVTAAGCRGSTRKRHLACVLAGAHRNCCRDADYFLPYFAQGTAACLRGSAGVEARTFLLPCPA